MDSTSSHEKNGLFSAPLSFAQERLWFLDQINSGNTVHNIPLAIHFKGVLNVKALEQSLREIVQRHQALRMTVTTINRQPLQVISLFSDWKLLIVDLTELSETERHQQSQRLMTEALQQPFDLATGPLLRVILQRLGEIEHILLLTIHEIVGDHWSLGIVWRELATLYETFAHGLPSPLVELPLQYSDYTIWQREWWQSEVRESALSYWKQQLGGELPMLELPTDHLRPPVQTYRGARQYLNLSKDLTNALKSLSEESGATLFITLLAGFKTLLYRYTSLEDMIVGSIVPHRNQAEFEGLIGLFANTLVMRTDLSGNPSFRELLGRVQEVVLAAYSHQDLPFEKLVEELQTEQDLSRSPLFQVMFILQSEPERVWEFSGLSLKEVELKSKTTKLDLTVELQETSAGIKGWFEYNADLFDADTINRMIGHWQVLLWGVVAQPNQQISLLPMLTEVEKHQLLVEWNDTATEYPRDKCIHQLFAEQVEKTPQAVAVVFEDQQLTYQELNQRANQLAHYLQSLGVGPELLVGICVERSVEMVVGILGILKAGGAYVPLDPNYPAERIALIFAETQASVVLTQQQFAPELSPLAKHLICLDTHWATIQLQSQHNPIARTTTDNLCYVMYTSGSTGRPKGVSIIHRGVVRLVQQTNYAHFGADEVFLQLAPVAFDASTFEIWGSLLNGARLVLFPGKTPSMAELGAFIQQHQITTLWLTAGLFHLMVEEQLEALQGLRQLLAGGDVLSVPHVQRLLPKLGNCTLINGYGPTENTTFTCCFPMTAASQIRDSVPIGRPIANTQVYLLDRHLQPVPIGVSGDFYIGGAGLARGYFNRSQLTAEQFITHPFVPEQVLYKTGDLARYLPDGNIEFLGRIDNQVKIRGFRIELGEIEAVINTHPQIQQAVVIARVDIPGNKRLVAYLVSTDESLTSHKLREFINQKLPEYMVPSAFMMLDTIPLTPNGKIDRKALPAPDGEISREGEYIAPRTPREEIIANIFAQVLNVQNVGIHDNFFTLGGHSLLATQLISRLRTAFDVEIPIREIFAAPTVVELDQTLTQLRHTGRGLTLPPIQPTKERTQLPLSWAQERLWFLNQLEGPSATYNIPIAIRITGSLEIGVLQQALAEIVRRHEVLRTSFHTVNGVPVQVIHPATTIKIKVVDLQQQGETPLQQLAQQEATTPFDLEIAPLIRCSCVQLSAREYVLFLTVHHIVADGWSLGVLFRELSALYQAFRDQEASPLAELPIQYADFGIWQRQWLSGEVLATQLHYWRNQLQSAPSLLQLPTDRPRPSVQTYRGQTLSWRLNADLKQKLQTLSRESGTTLFMTLYAAFATLLYRYSSESDILIGTPIANRTRNEIEPLIGFFVNTLVLRTQFADNPSFENLLAQVRETTLQAYEHQDAPFEQVVETLQPQRSLSHSPLFQVMFILQNAPMGELELPGCTWYGVEQDSTIAKFDLTVSILETDQGLVGSWQYNTDLFDSSTIERMSAHFQNLLSAIVENPRQTVGELPLLSELERHQLLVEWNDTATEYPADKCIHQLFAEQVERTPDNMAVVFEDQQLTYLQLNQRANQLAHHLQGLGVGPEVLVGICVERSVEMVVGILGILKAGGAYVPLDPNYPQERLGYMLTDSGVGVLLTQQSLLESLPQHTAQVICLDTDWEAIQQHSQENLDSGVCADNLVYVIYTSGSTGLPKGVMNTHQGVHNRLLWMQQSYHLTSSDGVVHKTPFSFDVSVWEFFWTLLTGAKIVVAEPEGHKDSNYLVNLIAQEQITTIHFVPSMLQVFLQETNLENCRCLKRVFCSGEALPWELTQSFFEKLECELHNLYGPTEAAIDVTFWRCQPQENSQLVPIGRPISNIQIYILDKHLQPVPVGIPGELHIGGAGLARGYLNRPELTAERFIQNPFSEDKSARLYKTGDLARYLPDGNIEYLGRIDNQVKIRGFRIELGEIEAVLNTHPQIQQAVVVARVDIPGDKRLVAYLVSTDESLRSQQLREFLKPKLPEYMLPSAFVLLDTLPLTPNGKIDRKALPAANQFQDATQGIKVLPQDELERQLTQIWQQVLGIQGIGVHDNFFELGGHSLLGLRLFAETEKVLGLKLPISSLFQEPTIWHLAQIIRQSEQSASCSSLHGLQTDIEVEDFEKLVAIVASRPGKRIRSDSLIVPINQSGSKQPFFLCANSLTEVLPLTSALGQERPIYLIESGLFVFSDQPAVHNIKAIASHHVRDILTIQPEGDYILGGYSFGGLVIYEIAKQLEAQGRKVVVLALIDVTGYEEPVHRFYLQVTDSLLNIWWIFRDLLSFNSQKASNYILKFKQFWQRKFKKIYVMQGYSGKIQLFLRSEFGHPEFGYPEFEHSSVKIRYFLFPLIGWNRKTVEKIYYLPGNHYSILKEPYVKVLADKLNVLFTEKADR